MNIEAAGRRSIKSRFVEIKTKEGKFYIITDFKAVTDNEDGICVHLMDLNGRSDLQLYIDISIDDFWKQIEEQEKNNR